MTNDEFLTRRQVEEFMGWSPKTLKKYWERGVFPAPIKWGDQQLMWRLEDVRRWKRGDRNAQSAA